MFKTKRRKKHLVLSVQDAELSALELWHGSMGPKIQAKNRLSIMPGIIERGRLQKPSKFTQAISRLLGKPETGDFTLAETSVLLPSSLYTHHAATIEHARDQQVSDALKQRLLEAHFSPKSDWQYSMTHTPLVQGSRLHLEGARHVDLQSYMRALSDSGLTVNSMQPMVEGMKGFYFDQGLIAEPVIWVWLGARSTEIALVDSHGTMLSESLDLGLETLRGALGKSFGYQNPLVETVLHSIGLRNIRHQSEEVIQSMIQEWLKPLYSEVKAFSDYSRHIQQLPAGLLFCGQGGGIPGVAEAICDYTGCHLRTLRSHSSIDHSFSLTDYYHYAPLIGSGLV